MFNTLASYLFWNTSNTDTENSTSNKNQTSSENTVSADTAKPTEKFENVNIPKSILTEVEDDWLLLDKEEEESLPRTDSEGEIPFIQVKKTRSRNRRRKNNLIKVENQHDDTSNVASKVNGNHGQYAPPNSMEESWFMTPPPCFTSTGPVNMETSPFENLLIEHPSMSVYHSMEYGGDILDEPILAVQIEDSDIVVVDHHESVRDSSDRQQQQQQRLLAQEHLETNNRQQLGTVKTKHGNLFRNGQKMCGLKIRQEMCRSAIERNNRSREVSSKNGRQRRSDMTHCKTISRANNNRKC